MNPELTLALEEIKAQIAESLEPDEAIGMADACKLLKIGPVQMSKLVKGGRVPCATDGGKFSFSRRDLMRWFRDECRKNLRSSQAA